MHRSGSPIQYFCLVATGMVACTPPLSPPLPSGVHFVTSDAGPQVDSAQPVEADEPEVEELEDLSTLWTVSHVEAAILEIIGDDIPNGEDLIVLFKELTSQGDNACPGEDLAFEMPEGSCLSEDGWEYFGFAPYVDIVFERDGTELRAVAIPQISFVITAPDGRTFSAGGSFIHEQMNDATGAWSQVFTGTFIWTGDGYPWIQAGTQVGWETTGERSASRRAFQTSGPIAVGTNWAYLDHIDWDNTRCGGIPDIAIRIRDELGRWYSWRSGADCSPCADVHYDAPSGAPHRIGELCLDLSRTMRAFDERNNFPVEE